VCRSSTHRGSMAIENGVQNAELGYILDPAFQIENLNGKPVVGGYICIYEAGTDNKYISYENFDGAQNPFKIPLKADGRAVILGDPSLTYDVYAYDSYGNQLFSRLNVQCNVPGNISIKGADTRIKNTDGTLDISLQTMSNNVREYTVNTRNKLLDVQSPLYFVENSQSATIIGLSGDYATTADVAAKLDTTAFSAVSGDFLTDKFEYDDNFNVTGYNGSAFASNCQTYSAGTNIDITDNVISVTGLPTSSDIENAVSSAVTTVENKFEYNENNYITAYNSSSFAGTNYSAGDYVSIENDTISVTGLQPSGDYATHDDLTAYQPSGDYATKTELESATSGKQDTLSAGDGISIVNNTISVTSQGGGIEQVSHDDTLSGNGNSEPLGIANIEDFVKQDDLSAYQLSGDYATHDELTAYQTVEGMTAYQPSGDYATHDDLTAYATTSLVSSISSELYSAVSSISGDFELVAGSGVELVDDPNAKTTTINVTAEGTPVTAIQAMIESATSGLQPSGDYASATDLANYQPITAMTAYQAVGDYLSANALDNLSGTWETVTAKADADDLTAYQTIADMTAYATVESLTSKQDAGDYLSASESANYYPMTGNPAGFLTEHQSLAGYLQDTDLTIVDNKITEISGVPLSAGDEMPESVSAATDYITATSGDINSTIDNVSSNSGAWGGSALPISAGPGIKFEMVNDTLVASTDETVLWEGLSSISANPTFTIPESFDHFERVKIYMRGFPTHQAQLAAEWCFDNASEHQLWGQVPAGGANGEALRFNQFAISANDTTCKVYSARQFSLQGTAVSTAVSPSQLVRVVGINKISGGN